MDHIVLAGRPPDVLVVTPTCWSCRADADFTLNVRFNPVNRPFEETIGLVTMSTGARGVEGRVSGEEGRWPLEEPGVGGTKCVFENFFNEAIATDDAFLCLATGGDVSIAGNDEGVPGLG